MTKPDWELLRGVFEAALERPAHEREAFVTERTSGDEPLRREIESLLAAHESAGQFLSDPAIRPSSKAAGDMPGGSDSATGTARLAPGTELGAFTILELLGSGGMGEVYRARDKRLDRFVAIKVLSTELDLAPHGRERFEREARAISRLSHPRICTVHDVGLATVGERELPFLVMELLDGETLATRLSRGPFAGEQALSYAIDIADALVAAHAQGIVHRDLKPANVMVTSAGVKLLDFGLAQLRNPEAMGADAAGGSSAISLTSAGLVFGTLPYMSPEQLRGEKTDARTDVFALGALLHEMLTGVRPFVADSQAGVIAAILEREPPPVSERQPLAPPGLDHVVRKCLAKNPDDRWQTARDVRSELTWLREQREEVRRPRRSAMQAGLRRWRQLALVGIPTIAAVVLGIIAWRTQPSAAPPRAVARLSLNLPPGVTLDIPINGTSLAIAPDGSRVAFVGVRDGRKSLFIHTLEAGKTVEIANTQDAIDPIFSPNSQWVAFAQAALVKKVPAAGGPIQVEWTGAARQLTWLSDGRIVRGGGNNSVIQPLGGGPLTRLGEGEEGHHTPLLLPDGSMLLTILRGGFQSTRNSIAVWPSDPSGANHARELVPNATSPQLAGDDAIVFARGRALFAAGFDSHAIRLVGEPHALDVEVQTTLYSAAPMYALAANGTLVYAEPAARARRLVWIDRQGREEYVRADEKMYSHLRISPEGSRVATYVAEGDRDLWVLGLDGSSVQKLTFGPARDAMPVWSPDGTQIFFTTAERIVSRIPADRSTGSETVFQVPSPERLHGLSITPDGKRLLTHWDLMPKQIDLRILEIGPKPALTRLVGDSGTERDGRLSPNGRWLAYQSGESTEGHEGQVIVRPFPDIRNRQWVISPGSGRQPIWSRDGKELFYRAEDGTVMSVATETGSTFHHGPPVPVVSPINTLRDEGTGPTYDVAPDGRRFLFIKAPELDIRSLTVVLNWDVTVKNTIARKR